MGKEEEKRNYKGDGESVQVGRKGLKEKKEIMEETKKKEGKKKEEQGKEERKKII